MTKKSFPQGSLLIELCIALAILGIMGTLTACIHSQILQSTKALRDDIQLLFLARSCIEEYKVFNEVRSVNKEYGIDVTLLPTGLPEWKIVTVTVTQKSPTAPLNTHYHKKKSLKLTARVYSAPKASRQPDKEPDKAVSLPKVQVQTVPV